MINWNKNLLDKYLAPEISQFVQAEIPDLTDMYPQAEHWLTNHFLNTVLRGGFKEQWRQIVIGYLRRSQNAFTNYHTARILTLDYLDGNNPKNPTASKYYLAVTEWENFTLQISMAIDLFKWLNQGEGAFNKNDGSKEQRIYSIANYVKHTSSCVNSGQSQEIHSIPLWLNNEGLVSYDTSVTYLEASQILKDISILANDYQDPLSLREQYESSVENN